MHDQPPWGYHRDAPTLPAPNASAHQIPSPSCPRVRFTHNPAPPTRPPPISQQYPPPGSRAHSASDYQQLDPGVFPSSSNGCYALPLGSQKTSRIPPAGKFVCQQKVKARITTDAWVIGIIVGVLHVCSKFTGLKYDVQFESVEGSGQYETRAFPVEDLSPYGPREPEWPNMRR